jgi:tartrate-resistant acid phosphatase type 5
MLRFGEVVSHSLAVVGVLSLIFAWGCDSRHSPAEPTVARNPTIIRPADTDVPPLDGTAGRGADSGGGGPTGTGAPTPNGACDTTPIPPTPAPVRIVVIGDYGAAGPPEAQAAALVKSLKPDFIITTGDNNYPLGQAETIDQNIGQFYREFICPYRGSRGAGATRNRFFPVLGNHDWYTPGALPYLGYFTLPGNERYYEMQWGDVHFFALDSDPSEPDGVTSSSRQAEWLKARLAASTARWKLVAMHHPPFSSGPHLSTVYMQWPYKEWGASLVLAGHDHIYERLEVNGLPYVISGLGGATIYQFATVEIGSQFRYNAGFGVLMLEAEPTRLVGRFLGAGGERIDEFVLNAP